LVDEGYASARNFCAEFAGSPWVLAVDADEVLMSGVDAHGIRIDCPVDKTAMATIEISNLKNPPTGASDREVRSTEWHRRLYRTAASVKWEGYVHEDLYPAAGSKLHEIAKSSISIDHLTEFRDPARRAQKREMYFWMLLRAHENPALRAGTNAYWYDKFVPENYQLISEGARAFSERSSLHPVQRGLNKKDAPEKDLHQERVYEVAPVRTLHSVPSWPWTGSEVRAVWCEWNHPGERSRTLQSIIDGLIAVNWPRFIKPGSTCIDIGAHSGDTAIPMGLFSFDKKRDRHGMVVAVEPNPEVFKVLEMNLTLNSHIADFRMFRTAITRDDVEAVEIADHGNSNCNGGIVDLSFSEELRARLERQAQIRYVARGTSLETLLKGLNREIEPQSINFIKIDCEGYDKEIIRSGSQLLNSLKPTLFMEWFDWFTAEDDADFFRAINEIGYIALYPDSLTPVDNARRAANVVCIHRSLQSSTP